jgi:signal transduction histidine kinase
MAPLLTVMARRRQLSSRLVIWGGLALYVALVYIVVVLGGGALLGQTHAPNLVLSVIATALVALGFERVQASLERQAHRWSAAGRPPSELLQRFSERVTAGYDSEDIPARMAKLLAEGTGAEWAQIWLMVAGTPMLAATWPATGSPDLQPPELSGTSSGDSRSLPVRHGGSILAVLRLHAGEGKKLTPVAERLFAGLAAQAGLVLQAAALRVELSQRLIELSARAGELQSSRERLVDTQDDERRRLERDIHDGAQQHLVALAVNLRLAQTLLARKSPRADEVLAQQTVALSAAISTLNQLSRGIYPPLLAEQGLVAALRSTIALGPIQVELHANSLPHLELEAEAALYFCCLEALQNVAKHSGSEQARVDVSVLAGLLTLTVEDDGQGFDQSHLVAGLGLSNMRDRIDAAGGRLQIRSTPRLGTRIEFQLPVMAAAVGDAAHA